MDAKMSLHYSARQLQNVNERTVEAPVVRRDCLLVDLAEVFARHETRHVLVEGDPDELIGIVSEDDLRNAMREFSDQNSKAWHQRSVESLLAVLFEADSSKGHGDQESPEQTAASRVLSDADGQNPALADPLDFVSISDGENLIALVSSEDVLLSWNRLEPALSNAATDPLTRLPNRTHFERRFHEEWHRADRLGLSLGLLIIDVDAFKEVNDSFGHLRGDMVLAAFAGCCESQLRSYDLVARYAGDEFVALTCGCHPDEIDLPIRRLQEAVQNLNLDSNGVPIPVTLSIGAAVFTSGRNDLRPDSLFDTADHCLYLAKKGGRNCAFRAELSADGVVSDPICVVSGQEVAGQEVAGQEVAGQEVSGREVSGRVRAPDHHPLTADK